MNAHTYPRLVGDIGGTNARFAWIDRPGAPVDDAATYPAAGTPTLIEAMKRYLADQRKPPPRWCAIGIANPVVGDRVQMTNHHWSFSISQVKRELGAQRFLVINDFTALALSLPLLGPDELHQIGTGQPVAHAPCGLVGPGTGLGVSGLLPALAGRDLIPINGEGGHVSLPAANDREAAVIAELRGHFGHVSAERAVSGPGLVNLYLSLCVLDRVEPRTLDAAAIAHDAVEATDPQCVEALTLFCAFLGCVAGNLALTLGARGGVYIGGGIVPKLGDWFERSPFRERFESKGRFGNYLRPIPTYVVRAAAPALLGAAHALDALPDEPALAHAA
ncbi:glucokinase [Schlegelella sp. S2-27]|uniref:Glucokinase n=1 Tax=Caldimonas mangrovi TaxID=2944811 RepID=A0ABT0YJY2_9BURK|nr:glucokinase [Caldimonas mangrovi]MCM5679046.1 glucokinase [Caldimonas mangrovi]